MKYTRKIASLCIFAGSFLLFDTIKGSEPRDLQEAIATVKATYVEKFIGQANQSRLDQARKLQESNKDAKKTNELSLIVTLLESKLAASSSSETKGAKEADLSWMSPQEKMIWDGAFAAGLIVGESIQGISDTDRLTRKQKAIQELENMSKKARKESPTETTGKTTPPPMPKEKPVETKKTEEFKKNDEKKRQEELRKEQEKERQREKDEELRKEKEKEKARLAAATKTPITPKGSRGVKIFYLPQQLNDSGVKVNGMNIIDLIEERYDNDKAAALKGFTKPGKADLAVGAIVRIKFGNKFSIGIVTTAPKDGKVQVQIQAKDRGDVAIISPTGAFTQDPVTYLAQ